MQAQIIDFINNFGYIGIALLIAVENVFPPIPSEVILTFAGFITLSSRLTITGSVIAATIGAVLGAVILYTAGTFLSVARLQKIVNSRVGKILRLKPSDIQKAQQLFEKHGGKTIFIGRFIPVVRSLISLPAGMTKMDWKPFLLLTTLGTLIWNVVLIVLGRLAGQAWTQVSAAVDSFASITAIVLVVLLVIGGIVYYIKRIKPTKGF